MNRNFYLLLTLIWTLNAISYVLMSILSIRQYRVRRTRWGGAAYCALLVNFAVMYLGELTAEAVRIATGRFLPFLGAGDLVTSVMGAVLLFHTFYNGEREYLPARKIWQTFLGLS